MTSRRSGILLVTGKGGTTPGKPVRNKAAAEKKPESEQKRRPRPPRLKERYASLLSWVTFANGDQESIPDAEEWPPRIRDLRGEFLEDLRASATSVFSFLCDKAKGPYTILRGPQPQWAIFRGDARRGLKPSIVETPGKNSSSILIAALDNGAIERLDRCGECGRFFVRLYALKKKAICARCLNRERQQLFYRRHQEAERKRKARARWGRETR
jgi:hypothetical protein